VDLWTTRIAELPTSPTGLHYDGFSLSNSTRNDEEPITFGALSRLHHDHRWPANRLGLQSKNWGFDLVAHGHDSEYSPFILGEVKKTQQELDLLCQELVALCQGGDPSTVSTNSSRKWSELLDSDAGVLWLVGPNRVDYIFKVIRVKDCVVLEATGRDALTYVQCP
jgi:hypothetical protein